MARLGTEIGLPTEKSRLSAWKPTFCSNLEDAECLQPYPRWWLESCKVPAPSAHQWTHMGQSPWPFWTGPVASDPGSHLGKWPAERAHSPRMSKQAPGRPCGASAEVPSVGSVGWLQQLTAAVPSVCFKPTSHPNSSAIRTNPFLCLTTTVLTPGEDARDSAAPPITITTALPFPLLERRCTRLDLLTGQRPVQARKTTRI